MLPKSPPTPSNSFTKRLKWSWDMGRGSRPAAVVDAVDVVDVGVSDTVKCPVYALYNR